MYAIIRPTLPGKARAWIVSFRRRGRFYVRGFHDSKYGGSKKALAAAIVWRDRMLARLRVLTNHEYRRILRKDNTSGAPGVYFHKSRTQPLGSWQAITLLRDGRRKTKCFSVKKYGHAEAYRRAVAARDELVLLVEDVPFLMNDYAKQLAARQQWVSQVTKPIPERRTATRR